MGGIPSELMEQAKKAMLEQNADFSEASEPSKRSGAGYPSLGGFIETHFNFSEEDSANFSRCQRPDGSYYGTGGTCRKGTPAGAKKEEEKKARAKNKSDQESRAKSGKGLNTSKLSKDEAKKVLKEKAGGGGGGLSSGLAKGDGEELSKEDLSSLKKAAMSGKDGFANARDEVMDLYEGKTKDADPLATQIVYAIQDKNPAFLKTYGADAGEILQDIMNEDHNGAWDEFVADIRNGTADIPGI